MEVPVNNLIQRLVNAIIRQEGMGPTHTNPGNLRGAPWQHKPTLEHGYWKPATRNEGLAGVAHVVALHVAQGDTLREFIAGSDHYAGYCPKGDGKNDPDAYIKHVMEWASITRDNVPLWSFLSDEDVTS